MTGPSIVVAVVVAATTIATSTTSTVVRFRDQVGQDANTAIDDLKAYVGKYTK